MFGNWKDLLFENRDDMVYSMNLFFLIIYCFPWVGYMVSKLSMTKSGTIFYTWVEKNKKGSSNSVHVNP